MTAFNTTFSPLKNDRFLRALRKQTVDATPVWMMRQAGRYLPEYRATRAQAGNFLNLCKNPELCCEVTLQPLRRFDLDAAILFSDILTIPDAMGLGLYFEAGEGPKFKYPVRTEQDIDKLPIPDPYDELNYVMQAVNTIRHGLNGDVPLIGFSGSPWTLATYMVEGGASKDFRTIKKMLFESPQLMHQLLDKIADSVILYLNAQIASGAQVIQIFDTWGGALSPITYQQFSLHYMKKIIGALDTQSTADHDDIPIILFTKNSGLWLEPIAKSGADCVGLDWTIDIESARARIGSKVALQGNMDPGHLYGNADSIRSEVARLLKAYGNGSGHVFNLGHGIGLDVNPDHAKIFVDAVHELSVPYHQ